MEDTDISEVLNSFAEEFEQLFQLKAEDHDAAFVFFMDAPDLYELERFAEAVIKAKQEGRI